MGSSTIFKKLYFLFFMINLSNEFFVHAGDNFDVRKYGAVADGKTDNSKVLLY